MRRCRIILQKNYTPYEGDDSFLTPATEATKKLWDIVCDLSKKEREAFELVEKVLEGARKEAHNPSLRETAGYALDFLYDFSDYVDYIMED